MKTQSSGAICAKYPNINTITELKYYYKEHYPERHFFDKSSTQFFDSKYMKVKTVGNKVFLLHNDKRCFEDYRREYKVRTFDFDTDFFCDTIFKSYDKETALQYFRNLK